VAVHPSDLAAALLALDAEVRLRARQGERRLPLDRFLQEPTSNRRTETALAEDELVVGVVLPAATPGARSVYLKAMDRQAFSFALVSVAARLDRSSEGKIRDARVVLGGVAPVPRRAHGAERILAGASPTDAVLQKAAEAALAEAAPLRHNAWKIPLAKTLVSRALKSLL
jgi:xanthine dehydrogenase YagS FAD-binding subunit